MEWMKKTRVISIILGSDENWVFVLFSIDVVNLFGKIMKTQKRVGYEGHFLISSWLFGFVHDRTVIIFAGKSILSVW